MGNNKIIKGKDWAAVVKAMERACDQRKMTTEQFLVAAPQHMQGRSRPAKLVRNGVLKPHDVVWCWETWFDYEKKCRRNNYLGVTLVVNGKRQFFDLKDNTSKNAFNGMVELLDLDWRKKKVEEKALEARNQQGLTDALNRKAAALDDEDLVF